MTKDQRIHVSLKPEETIIVTVAELAQIFKCDTRTISRFGTSGILVRAAAQGKYDLLQSVSNYILHLRRVASGLTTVDAKLLALQSLTDLRNTQRIAIEQKSANEYMRTEDVKMAFKLSSKFFREKNLELPAKLRRKIEDAHPYLIESRAQAVKIEEDIEDCVFEVMEAISDEPVEALEPAT